MTVPGDRRRAVETKFVRSQYGKPAVLKPRAGQIDFAAAGGENAVSGLDASAAAIVEDNAGLAVACSLLTDREPGRGGAFPWSARPDYNFDRWPPVLPLKVFVLPL
ncbi:MAG TPA: hypothetical protein DDZ88_04000 [Verrucomicrobiales bacterium]|nr:hypothetical protein [Verrucomicrobiales bacterium]